MFSALSQHCPDQCIPHILLPQSLQSVYFVLIESTADFSHSEWPFYLSMLIILFFFLFLIFQFPVFWGDCLHGHLFQQLLDHHGILLPGRASMGICCFLWHNKHQFSFQTVCFSWIWFVALSSTKNLLSDTLMMLNNVSWPKLGHKNESVCVCVCAFACVCRRRGRLYKCIKLLDYCSSSPW